MKLAEIKQKMKDEVGEEVLRELIELEGRGDPRNRFEEVFGCKFEIISSEPIDGEYEWVWKIGERFFANYGDYSSEGGAELNWPLDFVEVVPTEVTITQYIVKKED